MEFFVIFGLCYVSYRFGIYHGRLTVVRDFYKCIGNPPTPGGLEKFMNKCKEANKWSI